MSGLDGARRAHERVGQAARVEPPSDRPGIACLSPHDGGAQRLEPVERVVEALDDEPLQARVAVRALATELVERAVAPDNPARKQHRAAGPIAFLEHCRRSSELASARSGAQSGHAGAGNDQLKSPFHNEALSRRAALDGPWRRPRSRPYLLIRALPASLPGTDHRAPATRPHHERDSRSSVFANLLPVSSNPRPR